MSAASVARTRLLLVMLFLLVLHFYVRPRLFDFKFAPDFLLVALLVYAIRSRPGRAEGARKVGGDVSGFVCRVRRVIPGRHTSEHEERKRKTARRVNVSHRAAVSSRVT